MVFDEELLEAVGALPSNPWEGIVYRHMFLNYPPERENTSGARWNPPDVSAIYTSLGRETVLKEAEQQLVSQPRPIKPGIRRTIYKIRVRLSSVVDLSALGNLAEFGIDAVALGNYPFLKCQQLGGAVAWLEHDGLLVPSGRHDGTNLVIYPVNQKADYQFVVVDSEVIN